jgi:PAS domain-containing protein
MAGTITGDELFVRTTWCLLCYAIVGYNLERAQKSAFVGSQSGDRTLFSFLRVFEAFPDGIVLIRDDNILFANKQVSKLLELRAYDKDEDLYFDQLKKMLDVTDVQRLGTYAYQMSVWKFL